MAPPARVYVPPMDESKLRKPEDYADFRAPLGEVAKGAARFADQTQAVGGGAVALGAEALRTVAPGFAKPALASARDWGVGVYQRNMEEAQQPRQQAAVARVEDIKLGEEGGVKRLGQWAAGAGTEGLLNVATMALGGIGGAAAGVGKLALKEGVKTFAKNEVAKAARNKAMAIGGTLGGALTSFGMEGGESFAGGVASGTSPEAQVGPSLAVGAINAVLDIAPVFVAAKYLGKSAEAIKGLRETILKDADLSKKAMYLAKEVGKGVAGGVAAEGVTEGIQELVQIAGDRWAKGTNIFDDLDPEQRSQILNAAAMGGLTGGLIGGGAGGIRGGLDVYESGQGQQTEEPGQETAPVAPGEEAGVVPGPGEAGGAGAVVPSPAPVAETAAKAEIENLETLAGTPPGEEGALITPPPFPEGGQLTPTIPEPKPPLVDLGGEPITQEELDQWIPEPPTEGQLVYPEDGMTPKDLQQAAVEQKEAFQQKAPIVSPGEITQPETSDIQQAQAQLPPGLTIVPETGAKGEPLFAAVSSDGTQAIWGTGKTLQELLDNTYAAMEQNPEMTQELGAAQPQGGVSEFEAAAAEVKAAYDSDHLIGINAEDKFDEFYGKGAYANFTLYGQLPTSLIEEATNALPVPAGPEAVAATPAEGEGAPAIAPIGEVQPGWTQTDPEQWVYEGKLIQDEEGPIWNSKYSIEKTPFGYDVKDDLGNLQHTSEDLAGAKAYVEYTTMPAATSKIDPIAEGLAALPTYSSPGKLWKDAGGLLSVVEASALHALKKHGSVTAALADPSVPGGAKNKLASWESDPKFVEGLLKNLQLSGKFGVVAKPEWKKQGKKSWYLGETQYRITETFPTNFVIFDKPNSLLGSASTFDEAKQLAESHYAQQNQVPTQPDGNVQQPQGEKIGQGQVPASAGSEGVSQGGQESQALDAGYKVRESDVLPGKWIYYKPAAYKNQYTFNSFPSKEAALQGAELDYKWNAGFISTAEIKQQIISLMSLVSSPETSAATPTLSAPVGVAQLNNGILIPQLQLHFPRLFSKSKNAVKTITGKTLSPLSVEKELLKHDPHDTVWSHTDKTKARYGVVTLDPATGQILLYEPSNHFSGYHWTFSKGRLDANEHTLIAAKREAKEELGADVQVIGLIPTPYQDDMGSPTLLYVGVVTKELGQPGWESQGVRWADKETAKQLIAQSTTSGKVYDNQIVDTIFAGPVGKAKGKALKNALSPLVTAEKPEVANTNPFNSVWGDHSQGSSYIGVIPIDPKTNRILLQKTKDKAYYTWTFAKDYSDGYTDPAVKAGQNTKIHLGASVKITGLLKSGFYGTSSKPSLFYLGRVVGSLTTPSGQDTEAVQWATYDEAKDLLSQSVNQIGKDRDLQILDVLYGKAVPAAEKGLAYKGDKKGTKTYFVSGQFATDWPNAKYVDKDWENLTRLDRLDLAVRHQTKVLHPELDEAKLEKKVNAEVKRRIKNFKLWSTSTANPNGLSFPQITEGEDSSKFATGKPMVVSVWRGVGPSGIVGDTFDLKYAGTSSGASDAKIAFFASNKRHIAQAFGNKVFELYLNYKNPKVVDYNGSYGASSFTNTIKQAQQDGYDGVIFLKVSDSGGVGTQFTWWDAIQAKTNELENIGYSPVDANIYHSMPDAVAEGEVQYTPKTKAEFSQEVDQDFGAGWTDRAVASKLLVLNETSAPNAPSGFYDPTSGKMTVNLDKLPAGEPAVAVLLHEGGHQTWVQMVGKEQAANYRSDLAELARQGNQAALSGISKALQETANFHGIENKLAELSGPAKEVEAKRIIDLIRANPNALDRFEEEQIGYYLQYARGQQVRGGLFRRIINAIKAWYASTPWAQKLTGKGLMPSLTDDLAIALVMRGMKENVKRAEGTLVGPEFARQRGIALESSPKGEPSTTEPLESVLGTLTQIPLSVLDYLDPPKDLVQNRRREFRQWLQDSFIEGRDLERKAELIKGMPLPAKQRFYDLFTQIMPKAAGVKLQQKNLWLDPMAKIAADNKFTAEDLNSVSYARTVEETNTRGRLMLAKQWLKYIRENEPSLAGQIRKDEKNLREQTRVPVLDSKGNQKTKNGKKLWKIDKKARQQGYYQLFKQYHLLASPAVFDELKPWDDKPSGMTDADARDILNKWKNDPRAAAMDELFSMFDEMNRQVPGWFAEAGLITIEMAKRWTNAYDHYATLHREGYEAETAGAGAGFSPAKASGLRQFSPKLAVDVFANSLETFDRAIDLVHKNEFTTTFATFVRENPEAVKGMFKLKKHEEKPYLDEDGMIAFGFTKAMSKTRDAIYWEKGIPYLISAEANNDKAKAIIRAINNVDAANLQGFLGTIAKATRFMATVNTSWSPEFFFINPVRDMGTALFNMSDSDAGKVKKGMLKNYKPMAKALYRVLRAQSLGKEVDMTDPDVQWVVEFQKNGGTTGWMDTYPTAEARRKAVENRIDDLTPGVRPMKSLRQIGQLISDANAVAENVIRVSTYKALREAFPNAPVSKHIGIVKDLTVNFNRRGSAGQAINALYMFANASVQGSMRIMQAIGTSKKVQKLVLSTIVVSALVDQLNRAMSQLGDDDEDKYDEIPDHIKERNVVIYTPWAGAVTIPAPWGYNAIWAVGRTISEAISAGMGDLPGWTAGGAGYDLAMTFFNAFNPISGGTLAQMVSPTILDPLAQISENKTPFGETLRPELFPGEVRPESEQYWANASGFSKNATKWINWATGGDEVTPGWAEAMPGFGLLMNPHHLDAVIGQVLGSAGRQARDIGSLPFKVFGEDDMELRDFPVVRKFATFPSGAQTSAVYHDRVAQVLDVKRRLAAYSEGPRRDVEKMRELKKESAPLLRMVSYTDEAEKQLKSMRKRLRLAEGRGDDAAVKLMKERMEVLRGRYNETWVRRVSN